MKPEDYNSKAQEARGRTFIDIGVSILKGILLLFTVVPVTLILKGALEPEGKEISLGQLFESMSSGTYFLFICFLAISFLTGIMLINDGLRHIHESDNGPRRTQ